MPKQKRQKLKQRKDGRYVCYYNRKAFYGKTSDEAIRARMDYLYSDHEEIIKAKPEITPTVEWFAAKWKKNATIQMSTQTKNELNTHINKFIHRYGYFQLEEIKPSDIKTHYTECYAGMSDSYIKAASQVLKSFFDAAVDDGYCRTNPARAKSAKPHKGTYRGHRVITDQERTWILTYCKDHRAWPAVMTMLYAGIRPQEAKALDIDKAVDLKKMKIKVMETAHIETNNKYKIDEKGKTRNANRTIPIFSPLYEALNGRHGYLIPSADGKQITVQGWRVLWNSYVTKMEAAINGCEKRWYGRTRKHKEMIENDQPLPPWIEFTVKPYDLRKSFCTMLRNAGVEMNTAKTWMGHYDARMILQVYDEVTDDRIDQQAKIVEEKLYNGQNTTVK